MVWAAVCRWFGRGARVEAAVGRILELQEKANMTLEELVVAFDTETTAVAHRIDALEAELQAALKAGQAPKPETIAALVAISDRLKVLGQDPAAPIPPAADTAAPAAG
jgi:hypothetical protein